MSSAGSIAAAFPPPPADAPPGTMPAAGAPLEPSERHDNHGAYGMAFADADVSAVANEVLGDTLKTPFVIDSSVTQKMSFRIDRHMGRPALLAAFESALALEDVVMVRDGGRWLILPRAKAKALAPVRRLRSLNEGVEVGYQWLAAPLAFASADEVKKALEGSGVAVADTGGGQTEVLVGGTSQELRTALQTIRLLDRDSLSSTNVRTVQLQSASPDAVASELQRLLAAAGASGVSVTPIARLNQLVITAQSPAVLDEAAAWVEKLDTPSREEAYTLWLYRPHNITAAALADSLNQLLNGSPAGDAGAQGGGPSTLPPMAGVPGAPRIAQAPALGGEERQRDPNLKVSVDKETNTLLVMAPESRWLPLRAVLDQMDAPPAQILIEATVLEVTLNHDFSTGVDWSVLGAGGQLTVTSTQNTSGTVSPTYPGIAISYLGDNVQAAINALASKTNVRVVSAPKLLALDNQAATLDVGDQVPIVTQTSQSTAAAGAPIVANTEYMDTGIILKIKPRVNGPDSVLIDFSQEVSSVVPTTSSTINSPTIQQRKFQTEMTLHDDQTVAIGGLISSNRTLSDQGIPLLKDIPGLGVLFKGQNNQNDRTEIIVLLSAHIMRNDEDLIRQSDRLKSELPATDGHAGARKK